MTNELIQALDRYADKFGPYPTIPLLEIYSDEWVIDSINKCLAADKDVEEMGYYKSPDYDTCI